MKPQLIALPLSSLISDLLHGHSDVPISQSTAEAILLVTNNEHSCYVQFPGPDAVDITGRSITCPRLWAWNHWIFSSERRLRLRLRCEKEAAIRTIFNANVSLVRRAILRTEPLTEDQATMLARKWVTEGKINKAKHYGIKKFYTTIEEIP